MKIIFKNTEVFYTSKGIGNPLVFLHGFLESSTIWEPFVESLSQKRQVICIDLPGHGQTGVLGEVHSMELMADAVHEVLQQLEVRSATFIGHSMGGYVALAFGENYLKMTKGLVLLNSTPLEDSREKKINRTRAVALVKRNKKAFVTMAINNLLAPGNREKFEMELNELKKKAIQFSDNGITAALTGMKIRTNKIKMLKDFNKLKIMISGTEDPIIAFSDAKNVAFMTNCSFYSLSGGHLSYLENAAAFREIMHFID